MATSARISWNTRVLSSCTLSFIIISLLRAFVGKNNIFGEFIVTTILCFGGSFGWAKLRQCKCIKEFFIYRLSFSYSRDAWEDTIDYEKGTMLKVKLKNMDKYVYGKVSYMGDVNKDPWISLMNYIFYDENGKVSYSKTGYEKNFIFNVNEVEYAEAWPVGATFGADDSGEA